MQELRDEECNDENVGQLRLLNTVSELLREEGVKVYLVGGAVRDALLDGSIHLPDSGCERAVIRNIPWFRDIDLSVNVSVSELMNIWDAILKRENSGLFEEGYLSLNKASTLNFESLILKTRYGSWQITSLRRDGIYKDGRHPASIALASHIEDDLWRRDFTVNAMAIELDSGRFYTLPTSLDDLNNRELRLVGNDSRLLEDQLRALRLFRFESCLGFKRNIGKVSLNTTSIVTIGQSQVRNEILKLVSGIFGYEVVLCNLDVICCLTGGFLNFKFKQDVNFTIEESQDKLHIKNETLSAFNDDASKNIEPLMFIIVFRLSQMTNLLPSEVARKIGILKGYRSVLDTLQSNFYMEESFDVLFPTFSNVQLLGALCNYDQSLLKICAETIDLINCFVETSKSCYRITWQKQVESIKPRKMELKGSRILSLGIEPRQIDKVLNKLKGDIIKGTVQNKEELLFEKTVKRLL